MISWVIDNYSDKHAAVEYYQIYAYQDPNLQLSPEGWRHVGDVRALMLPMAVTLTQFQEDKRYHFAVRAVDIYKRCGPFSAPKTWGV